MKTLHIIITLLISLNVYSQMNDVVSPTIRFDELEIKFNDVLIRTDKDADSLLFKENAYLYIDLGETVQGITIEITNTRLKNIKIEQRYQTSISIMNQGPHLDLLDWKHHESVWNELILREGTKTKSQIYTEEQEKLFPDFTEAELIDYIEKLGYKSYAKLIKEPEFEDGSKHWWIGLSKVSFRITGTDRNNSTVSKLIEFEIPMGC